MTPTSGAAEDRRPRIGLLTIHGSDNFGSVLQASCLAQALGRHGDVEVIDHRPLTLNLGYYQDLLPYQVLRRTLNPDLVSFARKHRRMLRCQDEMLPLGPRLRRRPGGDVFGSYDLVVVGSDEVWSTRWGSQPQFLFTGAPPDTPRIAYAASVGRSSAVAGGDAAADELGRFSSVLVRDGATERAVADLGRPADAVVCDPVLLADPDDLRALAPPVHTGRSTVIYAESCRHDERIGRAIKLAGASRHAVSVGFPSPGYSSRVAADARDFVGMVAEAELVVTSMFHGVVTALALGRPVAILAQESKRQKVEDLLARVDAEVTAQEGDITVVSSAPGVEAFRASSRAHLDQAVTDAVAALRS